MEKLTSKERAKHQPKSFSSHDLVHDVSSRKGRISVS